MKKFCSLMVAIFILISLCTSLAFAEDEDDYSNSFFLGQYQQERSEDYYGNKAIEWLILDVDEAEEKVLLISFYALDIQPFDSDQRAESWSDSSIRRWLNHDFYNNAFTDKEKQIILTTTVDNGKRQNNPDWDSKGSKDTDDKVFLLSVAEYQEYFPEGETCPYTEYAQELALKIFKESGSWWLRSPGKKDGEFCIVEKGKFSSRDADKATGICPAIWVKYSADRSSFPFERFLDALELEENGDYLKAFEIYDELGTYEYGHYNAAGTLLQYAMEIEDSDNYEEIIQRVYNYQNYCAEYDLDFNEDYYEVSSHDMLNEANYQIACREQANGNYDNAIELFSKLGQYEDSMSRLFACFKETRINYQLISSDIIELVNAGDKSGYSKKNAIEKGDPHNGWKLGSFLISGFTEAEDSDIPVFLKKPGDNLMLWFSIDQDIDELNGNSKLSITVDKKGQDVPFQYPTQPTDFGRGALLVRHVTSTSEKTNLYTDYLSAKESEDANTYIELKEEGTYTIALDYLIKDSSLTKALKSTTGYRMSFSFKVKNANGLAYLRELETGMELQDYARTENGFRIDFANSKSLHADVVRYAINQAGNALDVRSNAPASENDNYSTIGYYIIKITNTETGNITEKHVFVGEESDLNMYIEADSSLESFRG